MLLALATPKLCDRFSLARTSPFPLLEERQPAVGPGPPAPPPSCSPGEMPRRTQPPSPPGIWQDHIPSSRVRSPHWDSGVPSPHGLRPRPSAASPPPQPPAQRPPLTAASLASQGKGGPRGGGEGARTQPRSGSAGTLPGSVSPTGHRKLGLGCPRHAGGAPPCTQQMSCCPRDPVRRPGCLQGGRGVTPQPPRNPNPRPTTPRPAQKPRDTGEAGEGSWAPLEGGARGALVMGAPSPCCAPLAPTWLWAWPSVPAPRVPLPLLKQGLPGLRPRRARQRLRPDQLPAPGLGAGWRGPGRRRGWAEERTARSGTPWPTQAPGPLPVAEGRRAEGTPPAGQVF